MLDHSDGANSVIVPSNMYDKPMAPTKGIDSRLAAEIPAPYKSIQVPGITAVTPDWAKASVSAAAATTAGLSQSKNRLATPRYRTTPCFEAFRTSNAKPNGTAIHAASSQTRIQCAANSGCDAITAAMIPMQPIAIAGDPGTLENDLAVLMLYLM